MQILLTEVSKLMNKRLLLMKYQQIFIKIIIIILIKSFFKCIIFIIIMLFFLIHIRFNTFKSLCEFYILRENQHFGKNHLSLWYTSFYLSCIKNIYFNVWCFHISCLSVLTDIVKKSLLRSTIKLLFFQRNFQKFKLHWIEIM